MERHRCCKCNNHFFTETDLKIHIKQECAQCSVCLNWYKSLQTIKKHTCKPKKCDYCPKVFRLKTDLNKHIRIHTKETPFSCDQCNKKFKTKYQLTSHTKNVHEKKEIITVLRCKCGKKCSSQDDLDLHEKDECVKCDTCGRHFPCPAVLTVHKQALKCGAKTCSVCGKTFRSPNDLVRHMRTHTKEKPFACKFCDLTYTLNSNLTKHLEKKHKKELKERGVKCSQCTKEFQSEEDLKKHVETFHSKKITKCDICSKTFNSPADLIKHSAIHTKHQPFQCAICGSKFTQISSLYRHTAKYHGTLKQNLKGKKDDAGIFSNVICDHCNASLPSIESYQEHVRCHHFCKICNRYFPRLDKLNYHLKVCGKKCRYCGNRFITRVHLLKIHERKCAKRDHFNCSYCGEQFFERKSYMDHVKKFCPKRGFCYKCYCANYTDGFDSENVLEVLDHVIRCKPVGKPFLKCYVCDQYMSPDYLSYHILDEILHSRLVDNIPCNFKCDSCQLNLPTEGLLYLHNQIEHPCLVNVLKSWDEELKDIGNIHMPPDKKELLKSERATIRELGMKEFEHDGKVPLHKCYVCLHPWHSKFAMRLHVRQCENAYGIVPITSKELRLTTNLRNNQRKTSTKKENHTPDLLQRVLHQLEFDIERNPHWVARDEFWGSLERKFNIASGYVLFWLPYILKDEPALQEHFKDKLSEVCVIPKSCNPKQKPDLIQLVDDENQEIPPKQAAVSKMAWKCRTCGTVCKSRKELAQHNNYATRYFVKKHNDRAKECQRKDKALEENVESTDYENIEMCRMNVEVAQHKCELCGHPYHSLFAKKIHVVQCEDRHYDMDCVVEEKDENGIEEMDWDQVPWDDVPLVEAQFEEAKFEEMELNHVPVVVPQPTLNGQMAMEMKSIVKAQMERSKDEIEIQKAVGNQDYWEQLGSRFHVPPEIVKKWHTTFTSAETFNKAYFNYMMRKYWHRIERINN